MTKEQGILIIEKMEKITVGIAVLQEQGKTNTKEHSILTEQIKLITQDVKKNTFYREKAVAVISLLTGALAFVANKVFNIFIA